MKKNGSKTLVILILAGFAFIALGITIGTSIQKSSMENWLYPNMAYVIEIDHKTDTLTAKDSIGHLWVVEGVEDYMEGDLVSIIMDSKGTDLIYDDEVVKMHYCGRWEE